MENNLDFSPIEFQNLLEHSIQYIMNHYKGLETKKAYHHYPQKEVEHWFDEPIPVSGIPPKALLDMVNEKVIKPSTYNVGTNSYPYVVSGGNHISILGDLFAAAINQNIAKWHLAPSISEIDKRIIQWTAEWIGFGKNVGGFIGTSGSSSNLDGLTVARNIFFEQYKIREKGLYSLPPMVVYCSTETHSSIDKSIELLGIGSNQLRKIKTHSDHTIDLKLLEKEIIKDKEKGTLPFCVIGNAGTVNTGAIDDLSAIGTLAKKHELWFHIDGAYGGLAASIDSLKEKYKGIDQADSIALDFHKWLYQPFEIGCLLVKNWQVLRQTYFKKAAYLDTSLESVENRLDFNEHHFLLSRNAKSLKAWMTLKVYGTHRLKQMMEKDIALAHYLSEEVEKSKDFELLASSELAISCFRYKGSLEDEQEIIEMNKKMVIELEKDGRIFIAGTQLNNEFVFRACFINHRKTKQSVDYLLTVFREVGQSFHP